ncbi:MAG TPA: hypothetical protein VFM98_10170 [Ramlibacter sp.]|uniref:hypothetical protein n=1 Tax=Ramlibacter sp. TaxID=1917967 RepID=UPI002D803C53|nr:hypothetical protein [Ramlibacter sp.]HET8745962.1 hypothetical protein [Ramlibacter sp.]
MARGDFIVQLHPRRPPGRIDRKAAVYASEIERLRRAGYTYEAIREALADVGVELSTSALRREVRRFHNQHVGARVIPQRVPQSAPRSPATSAPAASLPPTATPSALEGSSGHDIAEAFFSAHPGNPLLRNQEIQ